MKTTLTFGVGNAKLTEKVNTFSLPAGKTCPFAKDCKSMAVKVDGKTRIKDAKSCKFRCFAASSEVMYPATFEARKHNLDLLRQARGTVAMMRLIEASLLPPKKAERIHVAGDFFNQTYFAAWMEVARRNPDRCFYAYTKSIRYWVTYLETIGPIPANFELNASYGGKDDALIDEHNLKSVRVVFTEQEAADLGLEIDHDDSLAMKPGPSFALLLHGTQPKGSNAAKAKKALGGKSSYSKNKK